MAADMFLKVQGAEGGSKIRPGEIEIEEWGWEETNQAFIQGEGFGSGKVGIGEFYVRKAIDKSSVELLKKCAGGNTIDEVVLSCRKAAAGKQEVYLTITFTKVYLTKFKAGRKIADKTINIDAEGNPDPMPREELTFKFGKMEWEFKPQGPDGSLGAGIKGGYDVFNTAVV
jgi:type VI secretion system secreted protein Hcp